MTAQRGECLFVCIPMHSKYPPLPAYHKVLVSMRADAYQSTFTVITRELSSKLVKQGIE